MKYKATAIATTNSSSSGLKSANNTPRASTVPRSVTKQAARIVLPRSWSDSPDSIITA